MTGLRGAQQAVMDIVGTVLGSSCTREHRGLPERAKYTQL